MRLMHGESDPRPWGLISGLAIAAIAGLLAIPLQVLTYRSVAAASQEDLLRNERLIQQVKTLEEVGNAEVAEHRDANQRDHNCIVQLALLLASPERDRTQAVVPPSECGR